MDRDDEYQIAPCIKDSSFYDAEIRPKFELKELTDEGEFEGYASVFGVKDLQDDIVEPGAFQRTIRQKKTFPFLWSHRHDEPIGRITSAEEDDRGLKVKGKLSMGVRRAMDTLVLMKDKVVKSMSIGFRIIRDEWERETGVRHLKEIDLWEISAVVFPANPKARIQRVKSVVAYQNLPLASTDKRWKASEAVARVRAWAGAQEKPTPKYRRAFLWYDNENDTEFGSYKMPIADVVDSELIAVPRAVFSAAGVIMGARGGVKLPDEDKDSIRSHLGRYYKRLDRTPPWDKLVTVDEILGHAVDLMEYAGDEAREDLQALCLSKANPSPAPFAWLDGEMPGPEPIGKGLFPHFDEYLGEDRGETSET